jgi:hypothetical protein
MPLAVIHSRALHALVAAEVTVEVHLANGLPSFTLVGLADVEVKGGARTGARRDPEQRASNSRRTSAYRHCDVPLERAQKSAGRELKGASK